MIKKFGVFRTKNKEAELKSRIGTRNRKGRNPMVDDEYSLGILLFSFERPVYGGVAQLGARLNGIQEASGSNPLTSTILEVRDSKFEVRVQENLKRNACIEPTNIELTNCRVNCSLKTAQEKFCECQKETQED